MEQGKNKIFLLTLVVLVLILGATTVYFYRQTATLKQDPQRAAQESTQQLIDKVSKLIVLPSGETPTVATVTDPEKLKKEQPFFNNASVGDKVLIYTSARKAYMYNPTSNKIIEVAPVNIGTPASAQ
ncbi:MAG: hypothetical protein WC725_03040 [Patescibacteria group bacterium]|jgi:hypothetical protein